MPIINTSFRAAAVITFMLPMGAEAATADGLFTFTDSTAFNAALGTLGTVSSVIADYDSLAPEAVVPSGTVVGGITHSYTGGSALVDLYVRDFDAAGTQTLGTLFDGSFPGEFGFDDAVTFSTSSPFRAISLDLLASPTFDFFASDVALTAGGLTLDVEAGAGAGDLIAPGVERRFFGIIAASPQIDTAVLNFNAPGESVGEIDNVTFYSVSGEDTSVSPVPLPASLPMLAAGFAAFGALSFRRRR